MNYGWLLSLASVATDTSTYALRIVLGGIVLFGLVMMLAGTLHHRYHFTKKNFFALISVLSSGTLVALIVANAVALTATETNSFERRYGFLNVYACGQRLPIGTSSSLANSTGDARHKIFNNGRLEFFGYATEPSDATLGAFFLAQGGSLTPEIASIPYSALSESVPLNTAVLDRLTNTNPLGDKYIELRNGDVCDVSESKLRIYAYTYSDGEFSQKEITSDQQNYKLTDELIQYSDCLIVDFDSFNLSKTKYTCQDHPSANLLEEAAL